MQIKVNGKFYDFFNNGTISTNLDAVASTFAFSAKYDPTNPVHKVLFKPLSYLKVEFFEGDRLLSTGTITNHSFNSHAAPELVVLSGYSLPGVLEDCQIPFASFPVLSNSDGVEVVSLESNNLTLKEITNKLIKPFGVKLIVYDSVTAECNQIIEKTVASAEETVKDYICKIANQKNVVVSHDIHGNLIMFRPTLTAKASLSLNLENTLTMSLVVDGQSIHSDLTCIRQPSKGNGDNPFAKDATGGGGTNPDDPNTGDDNKLKISTMDTVKNPLVGTFRPLVDVLSSGTFFDTKRAAQNKRAAELKNIKLSFSLNYWPVVSVGDIVEVINPELFINSITRMVLESTVISETPTEKTMTGILVLPETFNSNPPKNIFS